jgi:Mn-dependent DtxR family transcriptional regulator
VKAKKQLAEAKKDFISKAAGKIEQTINRVISEEVKSFRDDITKARENDFGRRIFESFANEYQTSYLNESKELKTLQKTLANMETKLNEANKKIDASSEAAKLTESKLRIAEDRYARKEKLNELMAPLGKEKKEIMSDLLESVKTDKLEAAFNKYLPSVLDGETPKVKKALSESVKKEHTGDKAVAVKAEAADEPDHVVELDYIKNLAGLSK